MKLASTARSILAAPLPRLIALVGLLVVGACRSTSDLGESPPRAYRFVLDGRPRMLVLPLDPEVWLAYDASHGSLIRAWKGGVSFEGSVYSGQHGPQPTTVGPAYFEGPVDRRVWRLMKDGHEVASEYRYGGHREIGGGYEVLHRLIRADGRMVAIREIPDVDGDGDGDGFSLWRRFVTVGLDEGESAVLETVDSRGRPSEHEFDGWSSDLAVQIRLDRALVADAPEALPAPYPSSDLLLPSETEAGEEAAAIAIVVDETAAAPRIDGEIDALWSSVTALPLGLDVLGEAEADGDLEASFRALYDLDQLYLLIEVRDESLRNDSEGAFDDDAVEIYLDGGHERQVSYDENDVQYVFRAAADGFWVNGDVRDHPGVTRATKRLPGGYVMELALPLANVGLSPRPGSLLGFEIHIDDDDDGEGVDQVKAWNSTERDAWGNPSRWATVQLGRDEARATAATAEREPGLAMRVFSVGHSLGELRRLVPGQTPNVNRTISSVELEGRDAFGGLQTSFLTELIGFLDCERTGLHRFRLEAGDGAKLWIANRPIAEVEPSSGATAEGEIELPAGEHRLLVRHFNDSGEARLRLLWQGPGDADFSSVPAGALRSATGGVKVTSPGTKSVLETRLRLRPGDLVPLDAVHPAFQLHQARPEGFRPRVGGIDFLSDGRMLVCSWDPRGDVWLIDDPDADDPESIVPRRAASGLAEPLGLAVVDDRIFVLQKQELTELIDRDGDDVIDEYRCVAAGWGVTPNFHEFAFGLVWDGEAFWATLATAIDPGGANTKPQNPDRGRVIRITMDGRYEFVAAGLRTPNGVGLGPDDGILVTDNQGDWLPASKLMRVTTNAFFGNRAVDPEGTKNRVDDPPIVWLPQGEIGNSPSEPLVLRDGPWRGQVVHGDVTHGGLKRTYIERVDHLLQGTVFRFTQGLEAGVNRIAYGPDGGLYVGGIGSTGNWGQNGKLRYGLQRLEYVGDPVFEMLAVETRRNGLLIRFTEPLAPGTGDNPVDFEVRDWTYLPTEEYGGPKIDERELTVRSATPSADGREVFLEIPDLRADRVVHSRLSNAIVSARGTSLWTTEAWTTINRLRRERYKVRPAVDPALAAGREQAEGFEALPLRDLRGWGRPDRPSGWFIGPGTIDFDPTRGEGGDLVLVEDAGDFELRFDWAVSEGGNSGVFYRAAARGDAGAWESGFEYQLLDDARHADGGRALTSSGACYALVEPRVRTARSAGRFNESRIVVRDGRIEHWLNGIMVVELEIGSEDFERRLAGSKFSGLEGWGRAARGAIVLQDHGDKVRFRNLRLRRFD